MPRRTSRTSHRAYREQLFVLAIVSRFPRCPDHEARKIATYSCRHDTGRAGDLVCDGGWSEHAVEVAVIAHVRHRLTAYEALLEKGIAREDALERVRSDVLRVLKAWSSA